MHRSSLIAALFAAFGALAAPAAARADRGAFTIDAGGLLSAAQVPPGVGTGDSVVGSLGGATVGVRYALRNSLEVGATAVWFTEVPFYNQSTTVIDRTDGSFSGKLQTNLSRVGAGVNAFYVKGLVWRVRLGAELGWSSISFRQMNLIDTAAPPLGNRTVSALVVAPSAGLEWSATDHLSFAITPRLEFLLGTPRITAVTVPITASWSWYGLFR